SSDLLSDSRRVELDLPGGGTMSFRCHGEITPEFLLAMQAMGEAATAYVRSGGCSDSSVL
ncbi:hypothetical protein, partial [Escherichia coli]|uniref:hypothetical protein n=1 Tax=Escherichia coli TaxID=562 RepID=UPI000DFEF678